MTRRERMQRRLEKREAWAGSAQARSAAAFDSAGQMASGIPFGQPILVGHHSERRDRNYRARIHSQMDRGVAEHRKAEHHGAKAVEVSRQLERSIFSDDDNAIEALEAKAKNCDENAAQCNAINRAWRKGGRELVAAQFGEALAAMSEKLCAQFSWLRRKGPMSATSDRAEARRCRERIKAIQAQQGRAQAAEAAGGVVVQKHPDSNWCTVTFADKPERSVLNALRAAGYRWGAGRWQGRLEALPPEVEKARLEAEQYAEERRKAAAGECLCGPPEDGYLCVRCEREQAGEDETEEDELSRVSG